MAGMVESVLWLWMNFVLSILLAGFVVHFSPYRRIRRRLGAVGEYRGYLFYISLVALALQLIILVYRILFPELGYMDIFILHPELTLVYALLATMVIASVVVLFKLYKNLLRIAYLIPAFLIADVAVSIVAGSFRVAYIPYMLVDAFLFSVYILAVMDLRKIRWFDTIFPVEGLWGLYLVEELAFILMISVRAPVNLILLYLIQDRELDAMVKAVMYMVSPALLTTAVLSMLGKKESANLRALWSGSVIGSALLIASVATVILLPDLFFAVSMLVLAVSLLILIVAGESGAIGVALGVAFPPAFLFLQRE